MLISSIEISNYKGFRQSGEIKLTSGFNAIVGQNNAGKTALLEAFALQISGKPHRSLDTIAYNGAPHNPVSRLKVSFTIEPAEFTSILKSLNNFGLPFPEYNAGLNKFSEALRRQQKLDCVFQNENLQTAEIPDLGIIPPNRVGLSAKFNHTSGQFELNPQPQQLNPQSFLSIQVAQEIRKRIYLFRAQRLSPSQSGINTEPALTPDASNLPAVLHLLQSNVARFRKFNENVRTILPDIWQITTRPINNSSVQINVWTLDPETQREDLAFSIS